MRDVIDTLKHYDLDDYVDGVDGFMAYVRAKLGNDGPSLSDVDLAAYVRAVDLTGGLSAAIG